MLNTTLIDILKTFSKEEMKKFEDMVRSPFFNKDTPVIKLFEHIKKYYPEFKNPDLKKEDIYMKMFPDKKYNYGVMKNLIYDLQKLSEKFITYHEMMKDSFEVKRSLVNGLREKNLVTLGEKSLKELENEISGKETVDGEYFLKMYSLIDLQHTQMYLSSKGNIHIREKVRTPYFETVLKSSRYLKKYYLLDTIKSFNRIITNKNVVNSKEVIKNCDEFLKLYKEEDFDSISLKLELNFLKMNLARITEKEFLILKKMVLEDLYKVKADRSMIYSYCIYLMNFCRIKNFTDPHYKIHAFDIVKSLVANQNYDTDSGYMNIVLLRNMVLIAAELREFHWCEKFLEVNIKKIHPDRRDSIKKFYNAFKNFYEGRFDKSLEYLSGLNYDDIFNKNYIKELVIINYFELKYFDLLNEQIESYRKFLVNNDSLPDSYKAQSRNFLNFITKLFKVASGKRSDLHYLKKKIENEKVLLYKKWFMKKLEELEILNRQ